MEGVSVQEAPAADLQEEPAGAGKQFRLPLLGRLGRMGETARYITAITVCAAVGVAGAFITSKNPESEAAKIDAESVATLSEPHYKPITDFDFKRNTEAVKTEASVQRSIIGHALDVIAPDEDTRTAYRSYFDAQPDLVRGLRRPSLKEAIHFRDPENTFSGEHATNPNAYPFTVFNATESPVDLIYMDYAMRAIRYWVNKTAAGQQDLSAGDGELFKVKPREVPHAMVLVGGQAAYKTFTGPPFEAHGYGSTSYSYGRLTKSVIPEDGPPHSPFLKEAIAVEMCQGMVNVYGERAVPGGQDYDKHVKNVVFDFNETATPENIDDLAWQEMVCNMLGRVVAAAYRGGEPGIKRLYGNQAEPGPFVPDPWLDYDLTAPEVPKFLWLADHVPQEWNELIAPKHGNLPTVEYYRQHHHL